MTDEERLARQRAYYQKNKHKILPKQRERRKHIDTRLKWEVWKRGNSELGIWPKVVEILEFAKTKSEAEAHFNKNYGDEKYFLDKQIR